MATVKDKLEILTHLVCERTDRIKKLTDEYNLIDQPNYGHIGDLGHVNDKLMELIRFLERTRR